MKVRCIDNTHQEAQLTLGKKYKVVQVCGPNNDTYVIQADDGRIWRMHVERFIVIEEE